MSNPYDLDEQDTVMDLVDDAMVTDPHTVGVVLADERDAAWRSGRLGEQVDGGADSLLLGAW